MEIGFVKTYRKMLDWEWFGDANCVKVFLGCIFLANIENKNWKGRVLDRGSFITSEDHLANNLKMPRSTLRRTLEKLVQTGEISKESTNRFTIITVNNYNQYQMNVKDQSCHNGTTNGTSNETSNEHQMNNRWTTDEGQLKNIKNTKEDKEDKKEVHVYDDSWFDQDDDKGGS